MHNHSEPVCFTIASCTCGFQLEIMFLKMVLKQICGTKDKSQTGQCTAITQRFYFTFFWVCVLQLSFSRDSFFFFFNWMFNYQHGFFSVWFVFTWIMLALLFFFFFCFVLFCVMWHMSDQWFFFYQRLSFVLSKSSLFCLHISFSHHPVYLHYNHPQECNAISPFLVVV